MSYFDKFDKKEKLIPRTIEIDCAFYELLEKLSNEKYDASINKLVNACIEMLIKNEKVENYDRRNTIRITRTFLLRNSLVEGLNELKNKYGIPIYLLVNISIRNALIEEKMLKNNLK